MKRMPMWRRILLLLMVSGPLSRQNGSDLSRMASRSSFRRTSTRMEGYQPAPEHQTLFARVRLCKPYSYPSKSYTKWSIRQRRRRRCRNGMSHDLHIDFLPAHHFMSVSDSAKADKSPRDQVKPSPTPSLSSHTSSLNLVPPPQDGLYPA